MIKPLVRILFLSFVKNLINFVIEKMNKFTVKGFTSLTFNICDFNWFWMIQIMISMLKAPWFICGFCRFVWLTFRNQYLINNSIFAAEKFRKRWYSWKFNQFIVWLQFLESKYFLGFISNISDFPANHWLHGITTAYPTAEIRQHASPKPAGHVQLALSILYKFTFKFDELKKMHE